MQYEKTKKAGMYQFFFFVIFFAIPLVIYIVNSENTDLSKED